MDTLKKALKAVLNFDDSITLSNFQDVANYGADCGTVGSFIYYTDTIKFYDENEDLINELLEETCYEVYGKDFTIFEMIMQFGRAGDLTVVNTDFSYNEDLEEYDHEDYAFDCEVAHKTLDYDNFCMKGIEKDTQYKNLMSWFLLEEVSRYIDDLIYNDDLKELEDHNIIIIENDE